MYVIYMLYTLYITHYKYISYTFIAYCNKHFVYTLYHIAYILCAYLYIDNIFTMEIVNVIKYNII